MSNSTL